LTIRVLICDDHGILRAGLNAMLSVEPGIEVVGEAGSSDDALEKAVQLKPDIILMDISMPGAGGIEVTRQLRQRVKEVRVIILTVHDDRELLQEALHVGAYGYVLKRAARAELLSAIYAAMQGDLYIHPSLTRSLIAMPGDGGARGGDGNSLSQAENLTPREIEVLKLIVKGYTNNEIGAELKISVRTVEFHRANLMQKLHLESRVGLVRYAAEHGLFDNNPPDK
jgi:two-component system response regulator NreC